MKNNKKGSALIVAMGLVILISLLAITILEYIIPFSRDIKGIENSAGAYYNASSAIEEALWFINKTPAINHPGVLPNTVTGNMYNIIAVGNILPPSGEGNSEFNKDWNKINPQKPIQLEIGSNQVDWTKLKLYIKVPNIDGNSTTTESFSGNQNIIQWQLTSNNGSLNASGSYIKGNEINSSNSSSITSLNLSTRNGVILNGTTQNIRQFYGYPGYNCTGTNKCTLKLSVINKLKWIKGNLPYLEWKLNLGGIQPNQKTIPLRYTNINTTGKSFGFTKNLSIKIPQRTTIDAFNFTIFQ